MERFETESLAFLPGQRVRARILDHHPWGVTADITGYERVRASIDVIAQFGATAGGDYAALKAMFPAVGTEVDAVVEDVRRYNSPALVRLSLRPADFESFRRACDLCGQQTVLSAGGDGLVLDARSNDGPGSTTIIAHRTCLADRIRPENGGERARALTLGRRRPPSVPG